jgi:hypothetical protein
MIRRLLALFRREDNTQGVSSRGTATAVSRLWLLQHAQADGKGGVDLPTWRTPREIARMRREERKQAMRRVA